MVCKPSNRFSVGRPLPVVSSLVWYHKAVAGARAGFGNYPNYAK